VPSSTQSRLLWVASRALPVVLGVFAGLIVARLLLSSGDLVRLVAGAVVGVIVLVLASRRLTPWLSAWSDLKAVNLPFPHRDDGWNAMTI
jgi:hypothetical protein